MSDVATETTVDPIKEICRLSSEINKDFPAKKATENRSAKNKKTLKE